MERTLDYRIAHLDDATLVQRLHALLAHDRRTCALMLAHLGEVDARGLYRDAGYSSLFAYCVEALHMSESEAALRIRAARLARQFPEVLQRIERGELHLSALRVLAPVLDESNRQGLMDAAIHKTKADVELLVAELAPKPDVSERVRKLPSPPALSTPRVQTELATTAAPANAPTSHAVRDPGFATLCETGVSTAAGRSAWRRTVPHSANGQSVVARQA